MSEFTLKVTVRLPDPYPQTADQDLRDFIGSWCDQWRAECVISQELPEADGDADKLTRQAEVMKDAIEDALAVIGDHKGLIPSRLTEVKEILQAALPDVKA